MRSSRTAQGPGQGSEGSTGLVPSVSRPEPWLLTCGVRVTLPRRFVGGLNEIMDINHLLISTVPGT